MPLAVLVPALPPPMMVTPVALVAGLAAPVAVVGGLGVAVAAEQRGQRRVAGWRWNHLAGVAFAVQRPARRGTDRDRREEQPAPGQLRVEFRHQRRCGGRCARRVYVDASLVGIARGHVDAALGRFGRVVDREPARGAIDHVVFEVALIRAVGFEDVDPPARLLGVGGLGVVDHIDLAAFVVDRDRGVAQGAEAAWRPRDRFDRVFGVRRRVIDFDRVARGVGDVEVARRAGVARERDPVAVFEARGADRLYEGAARVVLVDVVSCIDEGVAAARIGRDPGGFGSGENRPGPQRVRARKAGDVTVVVVDVERARGAQCQPARIVVGAGVGARLAGRRQGLALVCGAGTEDVDRAAVVVGNIEAAGAVHDQATGTVEVAERRWRHRRRGWRRRRREDEERIGCPSSRDRQAEGRAEGQQDGAAPNSGRRLRTVPITAPPYLTALPCATALRWARP